MNRRNVLSKIAGFFGVATAAKAAEQVTARTEGKNIAWAESNILWQGSRDRYWAFTPYQLTPLDTFEEYILIKVRNSGRKVLFFKGVSGGYHSVGRSSGSPAANEGIFNYGVESLTEYDSFCIHVSINKIEVDVIATKGGLELRTSNHFQGLGYYGVFIGKPGGFRKDME